MRSSVCARVIVNVSELLTRAHSQHTEIISRNGPDTSGEQPCVMNRSADGNYNAVYWKSSGGLITTMRRTTCSRTEIIRTFCTRFCGGRACDLCTCSILGHKEGTMLTSYASACACMF